VNSKQGTLQSVILERVLAAATFNLYPRGLYNKGHFSLGSTHADGVKLSKNSNLFSQALSAQVQAGYPPIRHPETSPSCRHSHPLLQGPLQRGPLWSGGRISVPDFHLHHQLLVGALRPPAVLLRLPRPAATVQAAPQVHRHQVGRLPDVLAGGGQASSSFISFSILTDSVQFGDCPASVCVVFCFYHVKGMQQCRNLSNRVSV
jgi:hypothetical protein